jgi:hypothetical protein
VRRSTRHEIVEALRQGERGEGCCVAKVLAGVMQIVRQSLGDIPDSRFKFVRTGR